MPTVSFEIERMLMERVKFTKEVFLTQVRVTKPDGDEWSMAYGVDGWEKIFYIYLNYHPLSISVFKSYKQWVNTALYFYGTVFVSGLEMINENAKELIQQREGEILEELFECIENTFPQGIEDLEEIWNVSKVT